MSFEEDDIHELECEVRALSAVIDALPECRNCQNTATVEFCGGLFCDEHEPSGGQTLGPATQLPYASALRELQKFYAEKDDE